MRDDLPSRSTVAAVLVLPLLAVTVLSGLGALADHEATVRLDQVQALAGAGQRELYDRATNGVEAEQGDRLLRAALEGGSGPRSGPDLAAWSSASTARVERMRVAELGLSGEVARLADRAALAADRRALAYGAALVAAVCFAAVLWLLAPRPGRRTTGSPEDRDQQDTPPAATVGGSGRPAPAVVAAGEPPPPPVPPAAAGSGLEPAQGLLDLARRGQELADQQLELLADRDHADPGLPGRLLQVDRLAGRARRNAYDLVVLAGGEPIRRWDRPAAMAEVVAAAVRDNRDAPRVDAMVADELLVPQRAADDLANLLGELVDNATAFSAPETRVRVSGQKTGSGYVLEVEDRGLGMTDEELDGVNRRLAGQPVTDPDLEQRLGTWVAGRLADRHDVKVQLRRSAHGGVTAFVFLPQHLVIAPPGKDEAQGAAIARLQSRRYPTQAGEDADRSLPKRAPNTSLAPDLAASQTQGVPGRPEPRPSARSPEEVRSMLARYRSGIERGRAAARDLPEDPEGAGRRPGPGP